MINVLIKFYALFTIAFHSLSFQDGDGAIINMSGFSNKKILIVNIASGSSKVSQLAKLDSLQHLYSDSLQVILFPSNSFGKEPLDNSALKQFLNTNYHSLGIIAQKSNLTGTGVNPVFSWLANISLNGQSNLVIGGDFQKFLIDRNGDIIGVFSSKVQPDDPDIISLIESHF